MISGKLAKRVDLEKLTKKDFILRGKFRVRDEIYHGWRIKPEFKQEGTNTYVPLDQLFPEDRFHKCYELIVQTPDHSEVVGSGYLHLNPRGDVSFGVRNGVVGQKKSYFSSYTVWSDLLTDKHKPIFKGSVDLIFVKVPPHGQEDAQRRRVLCD